MKASLLPIFLSAALLTASSALAQQVLPPGHPAPGPPPPVGQTPQPQAGGAPASGPANICQELVTFLTPKPPAPAAAPAAGAPVPAQTPTPPKPTTTLEQAQALAAANDIMACRDVVQKERKAGVAVPAPVLALAALKPELLQTAPPAAAQTPTDPAAAAPAQPR